jgi:hypothetical protein
VTVNGVVATLGTQANATDDVRVDGQAAGAPTRHVYLALHKPVGIECTTDTRVPHNIVDFVAHRERVFPIGRLDKDSEGLILLTNDGDIVNLLLRAEHEHEKEYVVTVDRPLTDGFLQGMVPHRADAGPEPPDPPDVRSFRLHGAEARARALRERTPRRHRARPMAEPHARGTPRAVARALRALTPARFAA